MSFFFIKGISGRVYENLLRLFSGNEKNLLERFMVPLQKRSAIQLFVVDGTVLIYSLVKKITLLAGSGEKSLGGGPWCGTSLRTRDETHSIRDY